MAENDLRRSFRSGGGAPFILFLLISLVLNGLGAVGGWWLKFPGPPSLPEESIQLTELDTNDVEKLGDPNTPEEQPPPEPEPTPPPPEPEPTPPPLDKPPEFEVPEPTPIPAPISTPLPHSTPKPQPQPAPPKPQPQPAPPKPAQQQTQTKPPTGAPAAPGVVKESATGVANGTGNGGPRSGTLIRSPRPNYPPQALQMHITGEVRVAFTVQNGNIVDARAISGPPMLGSYVMRFCKENWRFAPNTNGVYTLPVSFRLGH